MEAEGVSDLERFYESIEPLGKPYFDDGGGRVLYCGDCREVLPRCPKVDLVCTDPPYEVVAKGGGIGARREYLASIHGFTDGGFDIGLLDAFDRWIAFCGLKQLPKLIDRAKQRWMLITWNKPDPTPLVNGNYLPDTEYIIHAFPNSKALFGGVAQRSRFFVHPCMKTRDGHPNEKPITLMRKLVCVGSGEGETILDLFAGSGTTLRAAKDLGRFAIGIEIEERYCKIAAERLRQEMLF